MKSIGIDVGNLNTKIVFVENNRVMSSFIIPSTDDNEASINIALKKLFGVTDIRKTNDYHIVSTGLGGKSISFANLYKTITTCLARGISFLFPSTRLLIDVGAETSTVIKLNSKGRVTDWANHDKCASGTGIFLQQMAKLMQMTLEEMSNMSNGAHSPADITSTCAVFAESEVISHVHRVPPTPREDIIAGIYLSVISRLISMCKKVGIEKDISISGGVALNTGLVSLLEKELNTRILRHEEPQLIAALGAALISQEITMENNK